MIAATSRSASAITHTSMAELFPSDKTDRSFPCSIKNFPTREAVAHEDARHRSCAINQACFSRGMSLVTLPLSIACTSAVENPNFGKSSFWFSGK
jgi:hypothetical protein